MMEWQPIETAPKDTFVRLRFADGRETWGDFDTSLRYPVGMWTLENVSVGLGDNDAKPTHWMPLPDPPEQEPT